MSKSERDQGIIALAAIIGLALLLFIWSQVRGEPDGNGNGNGNGNGGNGELRDFIVLNPDFKALTQGANLTFEKIFLENIGEIGINSISLRLNDPFGIFSTFQVKYDIQYRGGGNNVGVFDEALNQFMDYYLCTGGSNSGNKTFNIPAFSNSRFLIYNASVKEDAPIGTFDLSFEITFGVYEGVFIGEPHLVIPWRVTIY